MAKRKKSPLQLAKTKAWSALSQAIRLEAADFHGNVQCVTCRVVLQWNRNMHAGHFIDGRMNAILFDERGIHPQCLACNVHMNGRKDEYFVFMEKHYGREVIDDLMRLKRTIRKFTLEELTAMGRAYAERAERARKEKGL